MIRQLKSKSKVEKPLTAAGGELTLNCGQLPLRAHLKVSELSPEGGHILPDAQDLLLVEARLGVGEDLPLALLGIQLKLVLL